MSINNDGVIALLTELKLELETQLAKNDNEINMGKLIELSTFMPNRLMTSALDNGSKDALQKYADSFYFQASIRENLVLRLNETNQFLDHL